MQCKQCANLLKRRWLPCLKMAYNLFGCSKSLWCYNFILNAYEHYNSRVQTGVINRHTYQALSSEHDSLQAKGSRLFGDAKSDKICHQNVLNYIKSNRKVYRNYLWCVWVLVLLSTLLNSSRRFCCTSCHFVLRWLLCCLLRINLKSAVISFL